MAIFLALPSLFRGYGGDPIRRCRKCGEPITRAGKLFDRHPSLIFLGPIFAGLATALVLISFMAWTVDRDFPDQCPAEECASYHQYVAYNVRQFLNTLKHL